MKADWLRERVQMVDFACIDVLFPLSLLDCTIHPSLRILTHAATHNGLCCISVSDCVNQRTSVVIQFPDSRASKGRCWRRSHRTELVGRTCCSRQQKPQKETRITRIPSYKKCCTKFANLVCGTRSGFIQAPLRLMKYRHSARIAVRLEVQS